VRIGAHPRKLEGFAQASVTGLRKSGRHGLISMFEIDPHYDERWRPLLERSLVKTCVAWLEAQWCTWASVPALTQSAHSWLLPELQAEKGPSGTTIRLTPRHPEWHLVLDGQTGLIHSVAGPEGTPPGPPPEPFQRPSQVWA